MSEQQSKPLVLHLAVDYPNAYRPENTVAVRNFINANKEIEHIVFALTRTSNPFKVASENGDGKGDMRVISMRYWGLPFGVFLALSMLIVAYRIQMLLKQRNIQPTVVHAHKFTFEGIAGWRLARSLHIPLVLSVRGEAESKILRFKPHYQPLLQKMVTDASRIYYVSAWFKPLMNKRFKIQHDKQKLLPNFVAKSTVENHSELQTNRLVTVLDLNVYQKKGLDRLLPAFATCLSRYPDAHLDIVGRGEPAIISEVKQLISDLKLEQNVSLLGVIPNAELQAKLASYAGLVLPSHNETFGMVYVEFLLAGVPILHSSNTGIDGFIDFVEARVAVDPQDVNAIGEGLLHLLDNQKTYRTWLVDNRPRIFEVFNQDYYVSDYQKLVRGSL
ncbi:MAG: glycosyltransferase [Methylophilus sp.]|jgi:glycosyltransferase involved in cell wall biosynthesis